MRKRRVDSLSPASALKVALYSEGGYPLHAVGDRLTRSHMEAMQNVGINWVCELDEAESAERFSHEARHRVIEVQRLEPGAKLSKALYDSHGSLLLDIGHDITQKLKDRLAERGIRWLYVEKSPDERGNNEVEQYRTALRQMPDMMTALPDHEITPLSDRLIIHPETELTLDNIEAQLSTGDLAVAPEGAPLSALIVQHEDTRLRSEQDKEFFVSVYHDTVYETDRLFKSIQQGVTTRGDLVAETCRRVMRGLAKDKDLLLNVCHLRNRHEYLLAHSVRVTVMATAIAAAKGYSAPQVYEVASGAFLHDIGMLRVPQELVEKPARLTPEEMIEVQKHPIYAIDLLQRMTTMPRTTPFVAYQSHEREDGSGYPRGRSGQMIHDFAKIIAVADIYDAMTSKRPYRPPMLPYHAMEKVVYLASKRHVDPDIVRAFLAYLSLFPVGSWVELNDGRIARVVATNPKEYTRPVVCIHFNKDGSAVKPQRINMRLFPGMKVVAAVDPSSYPVVSAAGF
ncbi:MAG: HD-GYP domain-containing protein [Planctomycetota bacterium]|nr:HD-GYP domain-containing protein [Planctomycetota bacterium]